MYMRNCPSFIGSCRLASGSPSFAVYMWSDVSHGSHSFGTVAPEISSLHLDSWTPDDGAVVVQLPSIFANYTDASTIYNTS